MKIQRPSQFEFVTLMASLMSIVALAIDALLPALDYIGFSIGTTKSSDTQLLVLESDPYFSGPYRIALEGNPLFIWVLVFLS